MSGNSLSGSKVKWLLLFLLLLSDLASSVDNPLKQNDTVVCGRGNKAEFIWKYEVKPFDGVVWTHNGRKIASSTNLSLSDKVITDSIFKGRLHFISRDPFSFSLDNATRNDTGKYGCSFTLRNGDTDTLLGNLTVIDPQNDTDVITKIDVVRECVSLTSRENFRCKWILPNGTKCTEQKIRYCSTSPVEIIKCHCDRDCKYMIYTKLFSADKKEASNVVYIIGGTVIGILSLMLLITVGCKRKAIVQCIRRQQPLRNVPKKHTLRSSANSDKDEDEEEDIDL